MFYSHSLEIYIQFNSIYVHGMNRYIVYLYAAEVEKGGISSMCGYLFVFTTILNKIKGRDKLKEFVKCISVKSLMGTSKPGIYLLTGIESTHGCRFRCLVTLHQPIRVENPLHLVVHLPILMPQKVLSSLIEIITHKIFKSPCQNATFLYGAILFLLFTTKRKQVDYF